MTILDDDGQFFGVVNVIDVSGVLFVVPIVVVGLALVFSDVSRPDETITLGQK